MNILCIDIGSYSIKSCLFSGNNKSHTVEDAQHIVLDQLAYELYPQETLREKQLAVVGDLIPEDFVGKIYLQLPSDYITSRYFSIPVTQKKKAQMMIPFQLDETLPYASHQAHYVSELTKNDNDTDALVCIAKKSEFAEFHQDLENNNIAPTSLVSELSVINAMAKHQKVEGPIAIVDIGHLTTKCYILNKERVVLNHLDHCAGSAIDEAIASTYNIPRDEAVIYKEENCFFLNDDQLDEINPKQKEFALLMKKTIEPLVLDMKRWLIGFRVKNGIPLQKIFLTGGTSNINNIHNYLARELGIHVEQFNSLDSIKDPDGQLKDHQDSFFMTNLMAKSFITKQRPSNFLIGDFSNGNSSDLPMHSMAFMSVRSVLLFIFLSLFVGVDNFFLARNEKSLSNVIKKELKDPLLGIKKKDYKRWEKKIVSVERQLKSRQRNMKKEIRAMKSSLNINALAPLFDINEVLSKSEDIELIKFSSSPESISGSIKGKNLKEAKVLRNKIKKSKLSHIEMTQEGNIIKFRL